MRAVCLLRTLNVFATKATRKRLLKKKGEEEVSEGEIEPKLKETELGVVAELMKNSRRSDRQLAKALHMSQPTVSRTIKQLEKKGVIKEYTMIPDFAKLGYKVLVLVFVKLKKALAQEQIEKARNIVKNIMDEESLGVAMLERGMGFDEDGVFITYHKDYSSYLAFLKWLQKFGFLDIDRTSSFVINLEDEVRYRPLTFSRLAEDIRGQTKRK